MIESYSRLVSANRYKQGLDQCPDHNDFKPTFPGVTGILMRSGKAPFLSSAVNAPISLFTAVLHSALRPNHYSYVRIPYNFCS